MKDQYQEFIESMKNSQGMMPNSAAQPGEEYGQFIAQALGKEEAHRRALRGDVIHVNELLSNMHTLQTPNATVCHEPQWTKIEINLKDPAQPLDLMDIKEIYAAFFRQWLQQRIETMKPDDLIKLGYHVGEKYP
jgi:hypothetical protein